MAVHEFDMMFTLVFGEDVANLIMSIQSSSWVSGHHGFMMCYEHLSLWAMNLANCCARLFRFSVEWMIQFNG